VVEEEEEEEEEVVIGKMLEEVFLFLVLRGLLGGVSFFPP